MNLPIELTFGNSLVLTHFDIWVMLTKSYDYGVQLTISHCHGISLMHGISPQIVPNNNESEVADNSVILLHTSDYHHMDSALSMMHPHICLKKKPEWVDIVSEKGAHKFSFQRTLFLLGVTCTKNWTSWHRTVILKCILFPQWLHHNTTDNVAFNNSSALPWVLLPISCSNLPCLAYHLIHPRLQACKREGGGGAEE